MSKKFDSSTANQFSSFYSPDGLLKKIGNAAKTAGVKVVYASLLLYHALLDKNVPLKDKAIVIGALGYFICPIDAIPDVLGPLGYTDDCTALIWALRTIWSNITPTTHEKARKQLDKWFEDINPTDLKLF